MKRGKPPTGRERSAHLSAWVLPSVLASLRWYCRENGVKQALVIEEAITRRCS